MRLFILLLCLLPPLILSAKEIAITFDDSPRFASGYLDGPTRAGHLLRNLAEQNVSEAAFFCTPSRNKKALGDEGLARLKTFSDAGHIIANHTFSHPNANKTSVEDYITDVEKADVILSNYPTFVNWFRFPYLREGNTLEKRDSLRQYLENKNYFNAYVTIDTYDWYMDALFQRAYKQNPKLDMEKVKAFFVDITLENIEIADANAHRLLGRSPKHVLLLHETDLVALYIGDLVKALREKDWKIISPKEAYTDQIADFELQEVYPNNPGRIGEMALANSEIEFERPDTLTQAGLDRRFLQMVLHE